MVRTCQNCGSLNESEVEVVTDENVGGEKYRCSTCSALGEIFFVKDSVEFFGKYFGKDDEQKIDGPKTVEEAEEEVEIIRRLKDGED